MTDKHIIELLHKYKRAHSIIQKILDLCQTKSITIKYFKDLDQETISDIVTYYKIDKPENIQECIRNNIVGWNNYDKLFIEESESDINKINTIVHEYIHYIRNANDNYDTKEHIFEEEFSAELVSGMVSYTILKKRITRMCLFNSTTLSIIKMYLFSKFLILNNPIILIVFIPLSIQPLYRTLTGTNRRRRSGGGGGRGRSGGR